MFSMQKSLIKVEVWSKRDTQNFCEPSACQYSAPPPPPQFQIHSTAYALMAGYSDICSHTD